MRAIKYRTNIYTLVCLFLPENGQRDRFNKKDRWLFYDCSTTYKCARRCSIREIGRVTSLAIIYCCIDRYISRSQLHARQVIHSLVSLFIWPGFKFIILQIVTNAEFVPNWSVSADFWMIVSNAYEGFYSYRWLINVRKTFNTWDSSVRFLLHAKWGYTITSSQSTAE